MYGDPMEIFKAFFENFFTPSIWIFVLTGIIIAVTMKKGFKLLEDNIKKSGRN